MVSRMGKFAAGDILPEERLDAVPFVITGLNLRVPAATSKDNCYIDNCSGSSDDRNQGPVAQLACRKDNCKLFNLR